MDRNWVFPVVAWHGYRPVVSQGHKPGHNGADIMFRREGAAVEAAYPKGTPNGSLNYFMPDGVLVVAAADGILWSASSSPGGLQVVLDHGKPWATYYQHMSKLFVPFESGGKRRIAIKRGQPLGVVGYSPKDGERLMHLHFEMWKNGTGSAHVNPEEQGLSSWPVLTSAVKNISTLVALGVLALGALYAGPRLFVA